MEIIKAHEAKIRSGSISLGDLAPTESDCSSARKRGDLGYFGHGDMQKEFEEPSFALKPGEMSSVVETASGLHLIERYVATMTWWMNGDERLTLRAGWSKVNANTQIHLVRKKFNTKTEKYNVVSRKVGLV